MKRLLPAMKFLMIAAVAMVAGCYSAACGVEYPMFSPPMVKAVAGMTPEQQAAFWANVPKAKVSIFAYDLLEKVDRRWAMTADPLTGQITGIQVTTGHKGDGESIAALGAVMQQLLSAAIAAAAKSAVPLPEHPADLPPGGGVPH